MILGADGKKLSKRHGATAVGDYQDQGILPARDAELPRAARLVARRRPGDHARGGDDPAVLARGNPEEAAVFDTTKLEWMNGQYLSIVPAEDCWRPVTAAAGGDGGDGRRTRSRGR